jgi:phosphatidylglycerophosphatase A
MKSNMPASSWKKPVHILAFGFGSGASPKAPGTVGTLAAIPLFLLLSYLPLTYYLLATLFICLVGIYICGKCADDLKVHDHSGIVWDEFAGYLITMIAIPVSWWTVLLGFFLFRLFDIWKPWPIKFIDRSVHGGLGIMLDDILAGLFSWVFMVLILYFSGTELVFFS